MENEIIQNTTKQAEVSTSDNLEGTSKIQRVTSSIPRKGFFCLHTIMNKTGLDKATIYSYMSYIESRGTIARLGMKHTCNDWGKPHIFYEYVPVGKTASELPDTKASEKKKELKEIGKEFMENETLSKLTKTQRKVFDSLPRNKPFCKCMATKESDLDRWSTNYAINELESLGIISKHGMMNCDIHHDGSGDAKILREHQFYIINKEQSKVITKPFVDEVPKNKIKIKRSGKRRQHVFDAIKKSGDDFCIHKAFTNNEHEMTFEMFQRHFSKLNVEGTIKMVGTDVCDKSAKKHPVYVIAGKVKASEPITIPDEIEVHEEKATKEMTSERMLVEEAKKMVADLPISDEYKNVAFPIVLKAIINRDDMKPKGKEVTIDIPKDDKPKTIQIVININIQK